MTNNANKQTSKNQKSPNIKYNSHSPMKSLTQAYMAFLFIGLGTSILTFSSRLGANGGTAVPIYAPTHGLYYQLYIHFGILMHSFIVALSSFIHSPYAIGWAVVIITMCYKLAMMPFNLFISSQYMIRNEKMLHVKPQIDLITKILQTKPVNSEQRKKLDSLKKKVYQENHIPQKTILLTVISSIITSLITVPLYQGIAYSPELRKSAFFTFDLAKRSMPLAISVLIIAIITQIASYISYPPDVRKESSILSYLFSPISIFVTCFFFPSIIGLYNLVSQTMYLIRTIISRYVIRLMIHKHYLKTENIKIKTIVTEKTIDEIMESAKN